MNREAPRVLKRDLFGHVELMSDGTRLRRDIRSAPLWTRWLARKLAAREARALRALSGLDDFPSLLAWDGERLERTWLEGEPMQVARPESGAYFRDALRLLIRMHRRGVIHNDSAKEPNWLVRPDGSPALIDFQVAGVYARRTRLFRMLAREDLRHLLKHKRTYRHGALTERQREMLSRPAWPARMWMASGKPVYLWITRKIFGWSDREGAGDRSY